MAIDVKTKIIAEHTKILAVHAGERRRYFNIFRDGNLVFLELPGFDGGPRVFGNVQRLRQHIRASEAIGKYVTTDKSLQASRQVPERRASSYATDPGDRAFNRFVGTVTALYTASVGDLVLVPSYGGQYGDVLIGEIQTEFSADDKIELDRYSGEQVPFRRVKWLPARVLRRSLSVSLSRRLENRTAATVINRAEFGREVFSIAYRNFSDQHISKIEFTGSRYDDPYDLMPVAKLVRYYVAAYAAIDAGQIDDIKSLLVDDLIGKYYDKSLVESFGVTFASPGKITLWSTSAAIGLFVMAGVVSSMYSTSVAQPPVTKLTNSAGHKGDPVTKDASERFDLLTNSIGGRQTKELGENGQAAKDKLDLKSEAVIDAGPP